MSTDEIKEAITHLAPDELAEFRSWLDAYVSGPGGGGPEAPPSFEAIRHLVGIAAGASDLATHPRHLDDFGATSTS